MEVRELIFEQMRKDKMKANWIWSFQRYFIFKNNLIPPLEEKCDYEMRKMCEEGIFEKVQGAMSGYRLTEKGYALVWKI